MDMRYRDKKVVGVFVRFFRAPLQPHIQQNNGPFLQM
jgi:hypothetical protein